MFLRNPEHDLLPKSVIKEVGKLPPLPGRSWLARTEEEEEMRAKEGLATAAVVGLGVAAVAGLAAGAYGTGMLIASAADRRGAGQPVHEHDVKRDEEGRIVNWQQLLKAVQTGGLDPELRAELWPVLLGVHPPQASFTERKAELDRLQRLYTKLVLVCQEMDSQLLALRAAAAAAASGSPSRLPCASPPSSAHSSPEKAAPLPGNLAAFADAHRIIVMDAVRTDLRQRQGSGGFGEPTVTILPVAVGDGMPELMEPPPGSREGTTPADAVAAGQVPIWRSQLAADTLGTASHVSDHTRRQMLRLVNILSAYCIHDPETGYCQGMADLAATFVQLFEDDALAFACFERLMRAARQNFKHDETGIRQQLQQIARILADIDPTLFSKLQALGAADCMFAYRMVVVMLRRELPAAELMTLWEMQWAHEAEEAAATHGHLPATVASTPAAASGASSTAPGIRSTVTSMSEVTARIAAEAGARPATPSSAKRLASGSSASSAPAPAFILQFIAAVVRGQRSRVLGECHDTDDVLRLFNALKVEFWLALAQARKQHKAYAQGAAVLHRLAY